MSAYSPPNARKCDLVHEALSFVDRQPICESLAAKIRAAIKLEAASCDGRTKVSLGVLHYSLTYWRKISSGENVPWEIPHPLFVRLMVETPLNAAMSAYGDGFKPVMLTVLLPANEALEDLLAPLRGAFKDHGSSMSYVAVLETGRKKGKSKRGTSKYAKQNRHAHILMAWPSSNGSARSLYADLRDILAPRNERFRQRKFRKVAPGQLLWYSGVSVPANLVEICESKKRGVTSRRGLAGALDYVLKDLLAHPDMPIEISQDLIDATDLRPESSSMIK